MTLLYLALLLAVAIALFFWLHGEDLSRFDRGYPEPIAGNPPSLEVHNVVQEVEAFTSVSGGSRPSRSKVLLLRQAMDSLSEGREFVSEIRPSEPGMPAGEWVLAPNSDSGRRLLYVHGGGFVAGSPTSHRIITDALARATGLSVFSLDYRLAPEHPRLAGIEDTYAALQWLANNGPDGASPAQSLVIAGDSAGGSLTLAGLQLARDRGGPHIDAAVAICPSTDVAMHSPSLVFNRDSDLMLGKSFGGLAKMPAPIRHALLTALGRRRPSDPLLSPLRGDLSRLPPTLIQVSLTEMLLDDGARYYHRAHEAGSPTELETYDNMVHVWHLFYPTLPEAGVAIARIADFIAANLQQREQLA